MGEKEAWDTLYVCVSTEIVNCIVKPSIEKRGIGNRSRAPFSSMVLGFH